MNSVSYCKGKVVLNELVQELSFVSSKVKINYWGAMDRHFNTTVHTHSFYEICYILDGCGAYQEGDINYKISPNTLIITRPDMKHQLLSDTGMTVLYVAFEFEHSKNEEWKKIFDEFNKNTNAVQYLEKDFLIKNLWSLLLMEATRYNGQLIYKELLTSLCHTLFLAITNQTQPIVLEQEDYIHSHVDLKEKIVQQIKRHINEHIDSPLRLKELSDVVYLSPRHLSRIFSEKEGISISDYIQHARLHESIKLLKSTDLSISDIAKKAGYSSIHYFSKVFSEKIGDTPRDFRKLYSDAEVGEYKVVQNEEKRFVQIIG